MKKLLLGFVILFRAIAANAQVHLPYPPIPPNVNNYSLGYFGPEQKLVRLDPLSRIPLSDIPMDRNFYLRMYFNAGVSHPSAIILIDNNQSTPQPPSVAYVAADVSSTDDDKFLKAYDCAIILMPPLKPNHHYELVLEYPLCNNEIGSYTAVLYAIYKDQSTALLEYNKYDFKSRSRSYTRFETLLSFYKQQNIKNLFDRAKTAAGANATDVQILTQAVTLINPIVNNTSTNSITISSSQTQTVFFDAQLATSINALPYKVESSAPLSLIADAGVIYAGFQKGFSKVTPYVGLCYSLRPYDSDLKFREVKKQGLKPWERLSFHLGLTLSSFAKTNYRGDIFGSNNVMTGIGYRLSNVICLTGGGVFYNNIDPNPLLDHKTVGFAPYFGISINLKIKAALGDLAKVFTYGK